MFEELGNAAFSPGIRNKPRCLRGFGLDETEPLPGVAAVRLYASGTYGAKRHYVAITIVLNRKYVQHHQPHSLAVMITLLRQSGFLTAKENVIT